MAVSPGSVLVCDVRSTMPLEWRIATCDRSFVELSGACFDSLLGRDLKTILHPAPVLHDSADCCRLQRSTHWFMYAPDLPPVVMTTTLLPSEAVQNVGASVGVESGRRYTVACHFARRSLPEFGCQTNGMRVPSVPCSPLFGDTLSYDKSLYVHNWSRRNSSHEAPLRSKISPLSCENQERRSSISAGCKESLAPGPTLLVESSNVVATTGAQSIADPPARCASSSHIQPDPCNFEQRLLASFWSHTPCGGEATSVKPKEPHQLPQPGPSIPNEMGSRSLFLANMSHELRTPLNGTVAIVELLLGTNVSPEQRDLLKTVLESSQSLTRILSSILDFSQLDAGLVELSQHPLNICEMVESCIDMVWPDALKKGLEVTVCAPRVAMTSTVLGDGLRIRQILVHLLSNAVKFTDQGSVEVEVAAEETATALTCSLKVKDSGIGVPESFLPFLFDSFTQATESCTRTHGGLGLGLAICSNLAKLMHADLVIANCQAGGTAATLSLSMPLAAVSTSASSMDAALSVSSGHEGPEGKDGLQSPTFSSSTVSRNSLDSTDSASASGSAGDAGEKAADAHAPSATPKTPPAPPGQPAHSQKSAADAAVSLSASDSSIPALLADSRVRLLQRHTAVIHTHSAVVARQLRGHCSVLGMAVVDMPVMHSPHSLQELVRGRQDCEQLRGSAILFCNATDAITALRSGWKKHPMVALCAEGRLPHALRVHVTPVAMPVKLRELTSAALLALHGGPGKDSLLHVPLGTPKTISASAGISCRAGFGGTACGFCTRCQRFSDTAAAAALHRRSLDNSVLERNPQRLSVSAACLEAVAECNDSSLSCNSCASSESNWAATEASALDVSRSENSSTSTCAEARSKADFVSSAGTESDTSGVGKCIAAGTWPLVQTPRTTSKGSLESHKVPIDAFSTDSSGSPVRPTQMPATPATSVCAATAMLGAQIHQQQQGAGAVRPVAVLASAAAAGPSSKPAEPSMRRSVSAGGITPLSNQSTGEYLQPHQQANTQYRGGVAMQSFLYRSARPDSALLDAGAERGRASAALQAQASPLQRSAGSRSQQSLACRRPPGKPAGTPPAPTKVGGKKLRLLVAEDNKINQLVVQKVVRKASPSCEIDVVENGEAALLAILERPGYDLVLMDIHMPKMDGLETTRRVRESHPTRPMIVALTADTVVGMRQKCLQAGMQDYITKPFHVKDMERILQQFAL